MNEELDGNRALIEARGLTKRYGAITALSDMDFTVYPGRIVGLIGRNGAGKTTALKAILGLTSYRGSLRVLGIDPFRQRDRLSREVSYIADVAVLPKWMTVRQAVSFVAACHDKFSADSAWRALATTDILPDSKIKALSKGMVVQLHLALVMAIDARLLVLDEPTLGLDIVYRQLFYTSLLNEYFDHSRTIIVTTHQVAEIENILTDVIFVDRGRVLLAEDMGSIERRYKELVVRPEHVEEVRALGPRAERTDLRNTIFLFLDRSEDTLARYGQVRTPRLADLFVAEVMRAPK